MPDLTQQQIVELFKDAPEGYDWYLPESDGFYASWIKTNKGITVSEKRVLSGIIFSFDFDLDNLVSHNGLIPKPVTAPKYTQAMYDADIIPAIGMEVLFNSNPDIDFKFDWNDGDKIKCVSHSTDANGYTIGVFRHELGVTVSLVTCLIKPLTPPIELDDGECYQFDYRGNNIKGTYDDNGKVMWNKGNPRHIDNCTNIQLLEVKS